MQGTGRYLKVVSKLRIEEKIKYAMNEDGCLLGCSAV
jgi:hypothetical protein